jgi:hypothetical protein
MKEGSVGRGSVLREGKIEVVEVKTGRLARERRRTSRWSWIGGFVLG